MSFSWFSALKQTHPPTVYCWLEALPSSITPSPEEVRVRVWFSGGNTHHSAVLPAWTGFQEFQNVLEQALRPWVSNRPEAIPLGVDAAFVWLVPASVALPMSVAKGLSPNEQRLSLQAQLEERWVFQKDSPAVACQPLRLEKTALQELQVSAIGQKVKDCLQSVSAALGFSTVSVVWQAPPLWEGIAKETGKGASGLWCSPYQWLEIGEPTSANPFARVYTSHPYSADPATRVDDLVAGVSLAKYSEKSSWLFNQHPTMDSNELVKKLQWPETTILKCDSDDDWLHWVQQTVMNHPDVLAQWTFITPSLLSSETEEKARQPLCWQKITAWGAVAFLLLVLFFGLGLSWHTQQLNAEIQAIHASQHLLEQAVARHHRELNNQVVTRIAERVQPVPMVPHQQQTLNFYREPQRASEKRGRS